MFLNFIPSMLYEDRIKVIIEFNSAHVDLNLLYLKLVGYNFEVTDKLNNLMYGAVLEITSDQVDKLKSETIVSNIYREKFLKTSLDKSLKLIGADDIKAKDSSGRELDGRGVRIAVVDTGIDYTHPDLFGFGNDGKVVGGYDFLDHDETPMDTDGHGTLVAGIIAANGSVKGVAPNAELIAYRIASKGDYVSTADMIRALDRAVIDDIDVVNISLGLDFISEEIDNAIEKLVTEGIVVVTAAGNNGETKKIGSPASSPNAISVGASLNNVTMSAASTLRVSNNDYRYNVIPMLGSVIPNEPINGNLVFGGFAITDDIAEVDVSGRIVLAERGGPIIEVDGKQQTEIVYFTSKEMNVARNGAKALIVYNNMPGVFHGTLINDNSSQGYKPSIPVVSVSMEEGLMLKELITLGPINARLALFYNPDIVAPFSSRGPVSPFYLKPTLVAPGAFINSTGIQHSYYVTSGTSFAAPHATGTIALLLQKNPELKPSDVSSILAITAEPLHDAYGLTYSFDSAGAGRLDVDAVLDTNIVATPYYAIFHLSAGKEVSKVIDLKSIGDEIGKLNVSTDWNGPLPLDAEIKIIDESRSSLIISTKLSEPTTGKFEGRVYVESEQDKISIPVIVYADKVALNSRNEDGKILLSIDSEENWTFAKVKISNAENRRGYPLTLSLTPSNNLLKIPARNVGEHWIEADVITDLGDIKGFTVLYVNDLAPNGLIYEYHDLFGIPLKETFMIISFLGIAVIVVYVWDKRNYRIRV